MRPEQASGPRCDRRPRRMRGGAPTSRAKRGALDPVQLNSATDEGRFFILTGQKIFRSVASPRGY